MTLIHRIWLGGKMPEKYVEYGKQWEELNPGYELHDWTEQEIWDNHWINQRVLEDMRVQSKQKGADQIAFYTHVADVIDYELMLQYGGYYFNTDLRPINPLSMLNINPDFPVLAMEDDIHPVNMAMYSPKEHPFFQTVIDLLPIRYFSMPGAYMNATTGVQLLEHAIREYQAVYPHASVATWPRTVFNPIHWSEFGYGEEPNTERDYPKETVAVHEWLHRTNQRGQRVLET